MFVCCVCVCVCVCVVCLWSADEREVYLFLFLFGGSMTKKLSLGFDPVTILIRSQLYVLLRDMHPDLRR